MEKKTKNKKSKNSLGFSILGSKFFFFQYFRDFVPSASMCIFIVSHTHTNTHRHTHRYIQVHTGAQKYTYRCSQVHTEIFTQVHTSIHAEIYTGTHRYTQVHPHWHTGSYNLCAILIFISHSLRVPGLSHLTSGFLP